MNKTIALMLALVVVVAAGWLGKKKGRGFYRYDDKGQKIGGAS